MIPSTNDVIYDIVILYTLYNTVYISYLGSSEKNALLEQISPSDIMGMPHGSPCLFLGM